MLEKPLAFIKKDLLIESSYKLAFLFNIFSVLLSLLVYFFIDKLFGQKVVGHLQEFGVNYFAYVLLGMAFFSYIGVGLGAFYNRIQAEQVQGTLEAVLLTPTKITTILCSMILWNIIFATFNLAAYIGLGILFFKINFSNINILSTLIILILSIATFSSLGILSASFVLVFKRGNPVGWIINSLEGLISGVYFPVTILPGWLQLIARFFPITYAIRAVELAVYRGYSVGELSREIVSLIAFSIILLPISFLVFKYALKKAKFEASLVKY